MMTRLLLLLITCVTLFGQRTPLKINGAIIDNPNFTNSASVTWTVVGANITGTSAGGGSGDTIWTNDNGTISATGTNDNIAFQGNVSPALAGIDSDEKTLFRLINGPVATDSNVVFRVNSIGGISAGSNANLQGYGDEAIGGIEIARNGSNGDDNSVEIYLENASDLSYSSYASTTLRSFANGGSEIRMDAAPLGADRSQIYFNLSSSEMRERFLNITQSKTYVDINPTAGPTATPFAWDTGGTSHSSGDLFSWANNTTNKITGTWDGVANAVGGFGSTASDAAVTISSTGWTNTFGKNAQIMMDGVALVYKVADAAGTFWYTNGTALSGECFTLQTGGKFIITSGTLNVGRAKPW